MNNSAVVIYAPGYSRHELVFSHLSKLLKKDLVWTYIYFDDKYFEQKFLKQWSGDFSRLSLIRTHPDGYHKNSKNAVLETFERALNNVSRGIFSNLQSVVDVEKLQLNLGHSRSSIEYETLWRFNFFDKQFSHITRKHSQVVALSVASNDLFRASFNAAVCENRVKTLFTDYTNIKNRELAFTKIYWDHFLACPKNFQSKPQTDSKFEDVNNQYFEARKANPTFFFFRKLHYLRFIFSSFSGQRALVLLIKTLRMFLRYPHEIWYNNNAIECNEIDDSGNLSIVFIGSSEDESYFAGTRFKKDFPRILLALSMKMNSEERSRVFYKPHPAGIGLATNIRTAKKLRSNKIELIHPKSNFYNLPKSDKVILVGVTSSILANDSVTRHRITLLHGFPNLTGASLIPFLDQSFDLSMSLLAGNLDSHSLSKQTASETLIESTEKIAWPGKQRYYSELLAKDVAESMCGAIMTVLRNEDKYVKTR